jgi:hypothetical protein
MKNAALPLALIVLAACARTGNGTAESAGDPQQEVTQPEVSLACRTQPGSQAVEERRSPFDSTRIVVGDRIAQVCYGRPSARGRVIFGDLVPYDQLWRTGANEPTILHLPFAAEIAGVRVAPGSYSLYTVPGTETWTVIVNRSITQWGHESRYTAEVEAQEVGRAQVAAERLDPQVETFTIRSEPTDAGADLVLEWERTRVRIPIRAVS